MITQNRKFIIEYLYNYNHVSKESAVSISKIHLDSNLSADEFNLALDSLLREQNQIVSQCDLTLYLTSYGQVWYEEKKLKPSANAMTSYERKSINWQKWAVILAAIGILVTILISRR